MMKNVKIGTSPTATAASPVLRAHVVTRPDQTPIVVLAYDTHAGTMCAFSYIAHLLTCLDDHGGIFVATHEIDTSSTDSLVTSVRATWRYIISRYSAAQLDSMCLVWPATYGLTAAEELRRTNVFEQLHSMFGDLV
jgi:hypothetical protein